MANFLNSSTTQESKPIFTPEALQAMLADFAQLQEMLGRMYGEGIHSPIFQYLSGTQPLAGSALAQGTERAAGMARNAVGTAGKQRGLSDRSLASTDTMLSAQMPETLSPLGQYAQQYGGSINSLADPRLASFLKPDTVSSSSGSPSGLQTATEILKTAGAVAGALA